MVWAAFFSRRIFSLESTDADPICIFFIRSCMSCIRSRIFCIWSRHLGRIHHSGKVRSDWASVGQAGAKAGGTGVEKKEA